MFFIGIGEWKNMKPIAWFKSPNAYTGPGGLFKSKIRKPDILGLTFDVIGFILIIFAIISFF